MTTTLTCHDCGTQEGNIASRSRLCGHALCEQCERTHHGLHVAPPRSRASIDSDPGYRAEMRAAGRGGLLS